MSQTKQTANASSLPFQRPPPPYLRRGLRVSSQCSGRSIDATPFVGTCVYKACTLSVPLRFLITVRIMTDGVTALSFSQSITYKGPYIDSFLHSSLVVPLVT